MRNAKLYFMIHSLDVVRGGMTRATLERAKLLGSYYDKIIFLTFDFNPDYDVVIKTLKSSNLWEKHMIHFNVYEFFMQAYSRNSGFFVINDKLSDLYHREDMFDRFGRLRKVRLVDKKSNQLWKDFYLSPGGCCFFEREFDIITGKTLQCKWFNNNENEKVFRRVNDYRNYFVQSLIKQDDQVVLVSDGRFTDRILFAVNDPRVAKVAVLHSHHLQAPYFYGSYVVPRNESLIKHLNKLDALVTLTERQAEDIRKRFGRVQTIYSIGHPVPTVRYVNDNISRDPYTAVIVARYEGIKQISHAIKAFKKVVKKVPKARLEIWGFGSEEAYYRRLIKRLRLEQNVFVKGFAHDPERIFRKAAFSIVTSKSEAFAMVILESMAVGTPVVSYACDYGPVDIIEHGKNGILIAPNDVNELAKAMIDLFENKQKRDVLSDEALKVSLRFARDKIARKWVHVFTQALQQKDQRIFLRNLKAQLMSFIFLKEEQTLLIKGVLQLSQDNVTLLKQHLHLSLLLRRSFPLFDQYYSLQYTIKSDNTILFYGKLMNFHQLETGTWDFFLSVSCLNDSKFIKLEGIYNNIYESIMYRMNKLKFKLYVCKSFVRMRVYRSIHKRRKTLLNYRNLIVSYAKQKVKAVVKKGGF